MMFKKPTTQETGGTRNERLRSKSVENVDLVGRVGGKRSKAASTDVRARNGEKGRNWYELGRVKGVSPVVTCVLPSLAMDFVASSLLAVGATPLITEGINLHANCGRARVIDQVQHLLLRCESN
jgi:hypothetical protein